MYKKFIILFSCILLGGCSKGIIPIPGTIMPEINNRTFPEESYGKYPDNYQTILKNFLQEEIINHSDAKVDFINKPSQLSINQLGNEYTGYRVCLSVNAKNRKLAYTGYKTHLFVINNGKVIMHLFDSGLLRIPFELCVDRNESRTIYLDDLDDKSYQKEEIRIDEMDEIKIDQKKSKKDLTKNIYILCTFNNIERTFVFNEYNGLLSESIGIDEISFNNVKFSTTHILGARSDEEILINRISGSSTSTKSKTNISKGVCKLLNSKKF